MYADLSSSVQPLDVSHVGKSYFLLACSKSAMIRTGAKSGSDYFSSLNVNSW